MATRPHRRPLLRAGLVACLLFPAAAGAQRAGYLTAADVRPLLAEIGADTPPDLPAMSGPRADAQWRDWIARRDAAIRSRLAEGDEDTLVNWTLLGTSFTSHPPVRLDRIDGTDDRAVDRAIQAILLRVDDLMAALAAPGGDERLGFARRVFAGQGLGVAAPAARTAARDRLVAAIQRVMEGPTATGQRDPDAAPRTGAGAPTSEFAQRGLSLDTSLPPNFAVHESLADLKTRGLLAAGSVRRVGIIGAGLDFADKNTGFDFYPVQTLQPFAVLDSLRRLELAPAAGGVTIVALDISPRVIDHIRDARAAAGRGYLLRLPLARSRPWLPSFLAYWRGLGERLGTPVAEPANAALRGEADMRTIRVGRSALEALAVEDVNIIVERPGGAPFDLVVATNVLLYYGAFDQALALANIGKSLRPGGILLTNTALPPLAATAVQQVGAKTTLYTTDRSGDEMRWYRRRASAPPSARP